MNHFVILLAQEYDQFTVDIPNPLETELSREELTEAMRQFYLSLTPLCPHPNYIDQRCHYDNRERVFRLPGTTIDITMYDVETMVRPNREPPYRFEFACPQILTIDEWFAQAANRRAS